MWASDLRFSSHASHFWALRPVAKLKLSTVRLCHATSTGSATSPSILRDIRRFAFGYGGDSASDQLSAPQSKTPRNAAAATALTPKSGLEITADIDESRFDCDGRGRGKTHTVRAHSPGHWILTTSTRSSGGETRKGTRPAPAGPKGSGRGGGEGLLRGPGQRPRGHAADAERGAD